MKDDFKPASHLPIGEAAAQLELKTQHALTSATNLATASAMEFQQGKLGTALGTTMAEMSRMLKKQKDAEQVQTDELTRALGYVNATSATKALSALNSQISGIDGFAGSSALGLGAKTLAKSISSYVDGNSALGKYEAAIGVQGAQLEEIKRSLEYAHGATTAEALKQLKDDVYGIRAASAAAALGLDRLTLTDTAAAKAVAQNLLGVRVPDMLAKEIEFAKLAAASSAYEVSARILRGDLAQQATLIRQANQLSGLFAIPSANTLSDALGNIGKNTVAAWVEAEQSHSKAWLRSLSEMQTPWAKLADEARSIRALAELHGIGVAVNLGRGFDPSLASALRASLGDWRDQMSFPADVLVESSTRTEFYVENGFDQALTDFPEDVFSEGLEIAGVVDDYLGEFELEGFIPQESSPEERAALKRTEVGYQLLLRLERAMRSFLNAQMTQMHGVNWPKHRLAPKVFEAWQEKSQNAKDAGRPFETLIEAADFTEYEAIICRTDNFNQMFKPFFKESASVRESFNRLRPLRLAVAHSRLLSKDDMLYLTSECTRLLRAVGVNS